MEIKVLGGGCANCKKLLALTQDAVRELDVDADVLYITDMEEIMKAGIMRTPALVVNGSIKVTGRVPGPKEVKQIIQDEQ